MKPSAYSRRFLRIKPDMPIFGEIRIVHVGERDVLSNRARVRLLDISTGGVRFASILRLPVDKTVVLEFSIEIEGKRYRLEGYVVRCVNIEVNEYEYGYCYMQPEPKLRHVLMKIFNTASSTQDRYIILRMSQGSEKEM